MSNNVRTWLVERIYSDDERSTIVLVYATPGGTRYRRKERSLTSFEFDMRDTYATVDAPEDGLGRAADGGTGGSYAAAATEMAESHEPTDTV